MAPCLNGAVGSNRPKAWVAAGGGLLVLGLVGYVVVVDRNCDEISDVPRGSLRFGVCGVANEAIAAVPLTDAIGQVTYTVRYHDGLKPGVST